MGTSIPLASNIPLSGTFILGGISVGFPWGYNPPYGSIPSFGLGSFGLVNAPVVNDLLCNHPMGGTTGGFTQHFYKLSLAITSVSLIHLSLLLEIIMF